MIAFAKVRCSTAPEQAAADVREQVQLPGVRRVRRRRQQRQLALGPRLGRRAATAAAAQPFSIAYATDEAKCYRCTDISRSSRPQLDCRLRTSQRNAERW